MRGEWEPTEGELLKFALRLAALPEEERVALLKRLPAPIRRRLEESWCLKAHEGQREPEGNWRVWLLMAGRGFGKTRTGAEWVWERVRGAAETRPSILRPRPAAASAGAGDGLLRVALAGANIDDVEKVMVKGESGLVAVAGTGEETIWVASRQMAVFRVQGRKIAEGYAYSGERPDKLRGPQHHFAWCDEIAKWTHSEAAWDNLMLGLRLGQLPRTVVTTTPRQGRLLKRIKGLDRCIESGGGTCDNEHLSDDYKEAVTNMYAGTRIGRQELDGELIEDVECALWPRALIEQCRDRSVPAPDLLCRIVIGVDPPAGEDGVCGIVAAALGQDGIGYVLADESVGGLSPDGWARAVARTAGRWSAGRVVAEVNQGGKMVESVLRGVERHLPLNLVHASKGKVVRAEPVAALFERGKARFAGCFPALEDELAGLSRNGGYEGPGRSPDRADAMVWALTELMLGKTEPEPRVRQL